MGDEWDRLKFPSHPNRFCRLDWNRLLSLALAVAWLVLSLWAGGTLAVARSFLRVAIPLACVWFPEELESLSPRGSSASLIRIFGWIALLATAALPVVMMGRKEL